MTRLPFLLEDLQAAVLKTCPQFDTACLEIVLPPLIFGAVRKELADHFATGGGMVDLPGAEGVRVAGCLIRPAA